MYPGRVGPSHLRRQRFPPPLEWGLEACSGLSLRHWPVASGVGEEAGMTSHRFFKYTAHTAPGHPRFVAAYVTMPRTGTPKSRFCVRIILLSCWPMVFVCTFLTHMMTPHCGVMGIRGDRRSAKHVFFESPSKSARIAVRSTRKPESTPASRGVAAFCRWPLWLPPRLRSPPAFSCYTGLGGNRFL